MRNATYPLHVLVVLVFMLCMKTSSLGSQSLSKDNLVIKCIEREREALLLFKQIVANEDDRLDSWEKEKEEDCCKWKGVGCDNRTAHVTHLYLSSLISPYFKSPYSVDVSIALLDLPHLNYLDFSSNTFIPIPECIGSLTNLVHLDFSSNFNVGPIPYQIGNLSNLQFLNLSNNYGEGPIPKSIGSLNNLRYLDLSGNMFTEAIPHDLKNLPKLQYLDLSSNKFEGPLPKFIGSLHSLRYLDLSNNGFDGVIPRELQKLSNLQYLNLSSNGPLSKLDRLFNLSSLTFLDLSGVKIHPPTLWASFVKRIPSISVMRLAHCNLLAPTSTFSNFSSSISALHLQGNHINSSIFDWLTHLSSSLEVLDLSYNVLVGRIPQSFGHMTAITHLNLGGNRINSSIFDWISPLNGSLVDLDLHMNVLEGGIPESFSHMTALTHLDLHANQLTGVLFESICNLSILQVADFSSNNFTGNLDDLLSGPLPLLQKLLISGNKLTGSLPDITQLSFLTELALNSNQLDGNLPTVFEHHSALNFLNLSDNHLRGVLPDFTRFSSLSWLYLDNNEFSRSLPDFTGLSSLRFLHLQNNEFSGSLPDFTGCSSLQVLRLGDNRLTEWETQSTGQLSSLEDLDLSRNSIRSTISELQLFNLSSLRYLRTSFNSLTFEFSSEWLPPFQLQKISLASCNLGPKFPNWIQNQIMVYHLDISNCRISDNIPIWFKNLSSSMRLIDLSSNHLVGSLPPIPAECLKINLSHNSFSGTLHSLSVVEDVSLSFLDVSHNNLCGALPDNWMHFQDLVFLNLGYNNFSGRIPSSIGHLVSLQTLILRNNKLYGELPTSLRNCSRLDFVDFGLNELSGKVPSWIGKLLPKLYALILKSNNFYGSLPYELCHLSKLHFLDLSMNRISGIIPPCFGNLNAMIQNGTEATEHVYSSIGPSIQIIEIPQFAEPHGSPPVDGPTNLSYSDNVLTIWKGQEFEYGRNFAYLKMIDLSTNELTGEIPLSITRLLDLKGLNLSRNMFHGRVPAEIGQLTVLECLDLSTNKFSGEIPHSMSGLNFLAYLDVSNNNFSGRIPSGTQLQGFNISTYEGNSGLCGKPLTKICPGDEPKNDTRPSTGKYDVDGEDSEYERWLYISAALGFSTSFWVFIGTLVLNRRWRHAYFVFLYNLKERFYVAMAVRIARLQRKV
ncbi:hypothetical protein POM88_039910 [Heracleum sosnowskyi]|uniref:Leucine-rich repeat-containing N-terminal plant-type domain-containing protein n=1 Tax=Heracleum sosnowskyi TaxID=360622 RepID=A0AAD8HDJ2_9APIA|nr:hypothetical protein POM88_039910 [Heracleum sosnowskyi]